jgi:transmembrane sensor
MINDHIWHLVSRKLSGEANLDELRELQQLLKDDPEMAYRVELYTNYFEHPLSPQRTDEEKTVSWKKMQSQLQMEFPGAFSERDIVPPSRQKKPLFITYKKWAAIAASLLIVAMTFFYLTRNNSDDSKQLAVKPTPTNEMNTMPGTRSKVALPDGTIVWLNGESHISYNTDFGQTKRELTLIGEAFFDVTHNPKVPMVVHAKNVNIWVKGTAFNVRSYPENTSVETSLIRGAVELTTNTDPERKILLKPNEKIVVDVYNNDSSNIAPAAVEKINTTTARKGLYHIEQLRESRYNVIPEISWVQNRLVFDNEAFTDVIAKMEKWYGVEIILENKKLAAKNFSGAFEKEDIASALQALQFINHFNFEIKGSKVYIK